MKRRVASFFSAIGRCIRRQPLPTKAANLLFGVVFPFLGLTMLETAARGGIAGVGWWLVNRPLLFLQNAVMLACLYALLSLLRSDRVRGCASILLTLVLYGIGKISYYKIHYRYEPILLSDVVQIGDAKSALIHVDLEIQWLPIAVVLALGLLAFALCIVFLRGVRDKRNVAVPLVGIAIFGALLPFTTLTNDYMGHHTDLVEYSRYGGTLYTAIAVEAKRLELHSFQYEDAEAQEAYREISSLAQADAQDMPNIILVLSESFTDQQHLSNSKLEFTETLMPFYEELLKTSASGEIYVPKMGGGTSETEFEILTGLQSKYGYTPYSFGLPPTHSIAAVLRERGYYASTLHWFKGVFYNRYKNLQSLGFDEFHTTDTNGRQFAKKGQYITDAEHYNAALQKLRQTEERDFIFCITMQNHGPYGYFDAAEEYGADTPFANALSPESEKIIRNYCYLLTQSDMDLRDFITQLSAFEEPTVVVFFGDHIPPFGMEVYEEIGVDLKTDAGHLTPYFIWSNTETFTGEKDMQAWQLSAYALELAGIHSDPFFHYIDLLRQTGQHEDERYELLSYDALFGRQAAYQSAGLAIASDHYQIGGDMTLLGFNATELDGTVHVLPRLAGQDQAFQLLVNGKISEDCSVPQTNAPLTLQCIIATSDGKQLNESQVMTFASTQALLQKSGRLSGHFVDLGREQWSVFRDEADYYVFATEAEYYARFSRLAIDGKALTWRPYYGTYLPGQYEVNQKYKPVYVSVSKKDFAGYEPVPLGIAAYMKEHTAGLLLFGE